MSYILEALKKSDRQRKVGDVPDLQTDHSAVVSAERKRSIVPVVVISLSGVLLVNFLIWLWWSKPWQEGAEIVVAGGNGSKIVQEDVGRVKVPEETLSVSPPVAPASEDLEVVVTQGNDVPGVAISAGTAPPVVESSELSSGKAPTASADPQPEGQVAEDGAVKESLAPKPVPAKPEPRVVDLLELPEHIQDALPEIAISLHFFSTEAASRLATINDRDLREGEMLSGGLRLEEITMDGVVLSFRGYNFRVDKF